MGKVFERFSTVNIPARRPGFPPSCLSPSPPAPARRGRRSSRICKGKRYISKNIKGQEEKKVSPCCQDRPVAGKCGPSRAGHHRVAEAPVLPQAAKAGAEVLRSEKIWTLLPVSIKTLFYTRAARTPRRRRISPCFRRRTGRTWPRGWGTPWPRGREGRLRRRRQLPPWPWLRCRRRRRCCEAAAEGGRRRRPPRWRRETTSESCRYSWCTITIYEGVVR